MARVEVPMPQMGESIAEGTVSTWLKEVGDEVERDEPILEISTDKVDAEVPSPQAGTLASVEVEEGDTVAVGTVVAYIETEKGAAPEPEEETPAPEPEPAEEPEPETPQEEPATPTAGAAAGVTAGAGQQATRTVEAPAGGNGRTETAEERLRRRSTPLVRRIAGEHEVDIANVEGSGRAGRVTKQDIMGYIDRREQAPAAPEPAQPQPEPTEPVPAGGGRITPEQFQELYYGGVEHPEYPVGENDRLEPMSRIRQLTADHMILAKRIAAHVHSFIDIDFTQIDRIRAENKPKWEERGVSVSYTAFAVWAAARALQDFPRVNATVSGDNLLYRGDINIGMAIDLDPGLIVPVIRNADELTLVGIAKRIVDLATRARERQLKPDEIQGATFSITNPGVFGTISGMPVIPEGTAAILGTGKIEKRPVVVEVDGTDSIGIRKQALFSLGYDHRIVDGADAARFLARLKEIMQMFPEEVA